jgi:hypothetical protein
MASGELMTDGERQAFLRGFVYGVEQAILVHDPLLTIAAQHTARLAWLADREDDELTPVAQRDDRRITDVMGAICRMRFDGAVQALSAYELDRVLDAA